MAERRPSATPTATCKCCGGIARFFAAVDASRTCEDHKAPVFPPSGEAVDYYRCGRCGFLFTTHFDALSDEALAATIYNDDYRLADPGFREERPRFFAEALTRMLAPFRGQFTALDFGGGEGYLARAMRDAGFTPFQSYDPFYGDAKKPAGQYDLVTAIEVAEHARDPCAFFRDMYSLSRPDGVLLFSTVLQPRTVDAGWWYIGPRNGHVSLHSHGSLAAVARSLRLRFVSLGTALHVFYHPESGPIARGILRNHARPILRTASGQGVGPLLGAKLQLARVGQWRHVLNPKHLGRAILAPSRASPE